MLRSEVISWPVTLGDPAARLRLAGRGRAAADADDGRAVRAAGPALPGHADHADLDLGDELRADVRARARDRLRAVHRAPLPRRVLRPRALRRRRHGGDDGHRRQGGAVQRRHRADLPERGDARPEPGVPLDEPRNHARGDLRARRDADAAPRRAREARPEGRQARAAVGALRRAPLARASRAWGERLWRRPLALRGGRARDPGRPGDPGHAAEDGDAVDQGRADLRLLARRLRAGAGGVRPGRDRPAADRRPRFAGAAPPRGSRARPGHRGADCRRRPAAATRWSPRSPSRTRQTRPSARRSTGSAPSFPPGR